MKKLFVFFMASMMFQFIALNSEAQAQVVVTNSLGGQTDITGTWESGCYAPSGAQVVDKSYLDEFSGTNTYSFTKIEYTTTDGSCGGVGTEAGFASGTFTYDGDFTAVGWIDVNGNAVLSPLEQAGAFYLPANPIGTQLTVTYTIATGSAAGITTDTFSPYVDETVAGYPVFYFMFPNIATGNLEAEAFNMDTWLPPAPTPVPANTGSSGGSGCMSLSANSSQVWFLPLFGLMLGGIVLFRRKEVK